MTDLKPIGSTCLKPATFYFWNPENKATVEVTQLTASHLLLRASKSYRLKKQHEDARETWNRNLRKLNDYLSQTFHSFQISVDYSDEVVAEETPVYQESETIGQKAKHLSSQRKDLVEEIQGLKKNLEHGFEDLEPVLQEKINKKYEKLEEIEDRLETILENLEKKKQKIGEWEKNGVATSYIFTFHTEPEIVAETVLENAVDRHLEKVYSHHRHSVKQVLTRQSGNFKLALEDLDHPRVLNRLQHTSLLNPASFDQIIESNPDLENELKELRRTQAVQFQEYALQDLETEDGVFERSKVTPAQAVQSILEQLDTFHAETSSDAPNTGPMIGTVAGTQQVVGFDPSEFPHLYIVGESGSGKSHFKRVLIENVASLGYHVLTINPGDTQNIGLSLPNENHENGSSILFNQYWIGDDRFLDKPDNLKDLFAGLNAITLRGLPSDEKQEFINDLFTKLSEIDSTDQPLFVFLDEAHNFNQGAAANSIQKIARESRKFGVNLVIASQSPTDYSYNQRHVRENTTKIFLNGEYFDYADNFLDDGNQISRLDTGQCIVPETRDLPRMTIDIRDVLTRFWEHTPSDDEIEKVAQRFEKQTPEFEDRQNHDQRSAENVEMSYSEDPVEPELTEDEEKVVEAIQNYIRENDRTPSKNKTVEASPFGTGKTSRILEQLVEKDAVKKEIETRYGNEAQVYSVTNKK